MTGWVCPRCGTALSPFVTECSCPLTVSASRLISTPPLRIGTCGSRAGGLRHPGWVSAIGSAWDGRYGVSGVVLAVTVALASSAGAQTHPGDVSWIAEAKAQVENLQGPCGAFQIINRAAWNHREVGLGVMAKPQGTHCEWPPGSGQFYSVDWLLYPDGAGGDMLINAETANTPTWTLSAPNEEVATHWRPPVGSESSPPLPPPPPPAFDVQEALLAIQAQNRETQQAIEVVRASLEAHRQVSRDWVNRTLSFLKDPKTIAVVLGILAGKFVVPGS